MNAATTFRATLYGLDGPGGVVPRPLARNVANTSSPGDDVDVESATTTKRSRDFVPVDWIEYKSHCAEQAAQHDGNIWHVEWDDVNAAHKDLDAISQQAWRIFTIYPYRDAIWVVKLLLTLGGSLMAISATLGFFTEVVAPAAAAAGNHPAIFSATVATSGAGLFVLLLAGSLALIATLNVHRAATQPLATEYAEKLGPPKAYKPALLGNPTWVWTPTAADLAALWGKLPFRAGVVNWAGLVLFNITIVTGFPGLLDEDNFRLIQLAVHAPLFAGFVLLVVANYMLLVFLSDRWYRGKWKASWISTFLAVVASIVLSLAPVMQDLGDDFSASIASFIGRWVFLVAILIGFYDLMAFHPNAWAGTSLRTKT
ncbi:hypothetical protein F4778DRAFT_91442 [Xylariomycetidae sp. FL2044]|nr:hypothetical protein F4778DRAFT_91442 [Xylariomycetidae sp. FL2044]